MSEKAISNLPRSQSASPPPWPLQIVQQLQARVQAVQTHLSRIKLPSVSNQEATPPSVAFINPQSNRVTKEELGRATWLFLHTLAAQYPERPTRQQQKDVKVLMDTLTRIYPCADCAAHFKYVLKAHPPRVSNKGELQEWMCIIHNSVNRRLGKPAFNCNLASARWGALECDEEEACTLDLHSLTPKR